MDAIDDHFAGYLLRALEPEEQRAVEEHLREHPEDRERLLQLRRRLDRLAADAATPEPPAGLWVRTLARVAERHCQDLPAAPAAVALAPAPPAAASWWRRADLLVAAALLLLVGGLTGPMLLQTWTEYRGKAACANNLRQFHQSLTRYSDTQPDGRYPWIQPQPPVHQAGYFVPLLADAKVLPGNVSITCPSREHTPPHKWTCDDLERLRQEDRDQYRAIAPRLGGDYAYSLGYRDAAGPGLHRGLTRRLDGHTPLLADCVPTPTDPASNSNNHGPGKGQNVLAIDGSVKFHTNRRAGLGGDDIYLNKKGKLEAGEGPEDSVLGSSAASPYPITDPD